MPMPLFSIITVTRENLAGLKKTAQSVLSQSFPGFEWIIIDGASSDGTIGYVSNDILGRDTPVLFMTERDHGLYDAMNKGIKNAKGFYVLFLNAGDTLAHEDTLAEIAAYIEEIQETPDFLYGDALETGPGGKNHHKPARPYTKAALGMFTHHQAMLYRRTIISDMRYDTGYKIAADYKLTLEFLKRSKTVVYCPFPICIFEPGGISQQQAAQGRSEQFAIRRESRIVAPLQNIAIAAAQQAVWTIRRMLPGFYWKLKSRA